MPTEDELELRKAYLRRGDVWLDALSSGDLAFLLADTAIGSSYLQGDPLLIVGMEPPRIMFANAGACALVGTRNPEVLQNTLLSGRDLASKRLGFLAHNLPPRPRGQLERVRLNLGRWSEPLMLSCRRIAAPSGQIWCTFLGVGIRKALLQPLPAPVDAPVLAADAKFAAQMAHEAQAEIPILASNENTAANVSAAPKNVLPPMANLRETGEDGNATPTQIAQPLGPVPDIRFNWRSDRHHVIQHISPEFSRLLGVPDTAIIGQSFAELEAKFKIAPHHSISEALAKRVTWSGLATHWTICDPHHPHADLRVLTFEIGGVPIFKPPHEFTGSRGYGMLQGEQFLPPEIALLVSDAGDESPTSLTAAPTTDMGDLRAASAPSERQSIEETAVNRVVLLRPAREAGPNIGAQATTPMQAGATFITGPSGAAQAGQTLREETNGLSADENLAFKEIGETLAPQICAAEPAPSGKVELQQATIAKPIGALKGLKSTVQSAVNKAELLQRLPVGVMVIRDARTLFINQALLHLLDYESETEFEREGGLERMFSVDEIFGDAEQKGHKAWSLIDHHGETVPMEGRMQMIQWDQKASTLLTFLRVQAPNDAPPPVAEPAQNSGKSEVRDLHAILDTATDGVVVVDGDGIVVSLNRSAQALFGYETNEVLGEPLTMLLAKDSAPVAFEYLMGLKTSGVASVLNDGREITGRASKGGLIPMFMTLGRVGAGENPNFCAVLRDLTQWKKVESDLHDARREAERASAVKSEFLAKISHEIRTPLNAILGFTEVMIEERLGPVHNERYKEYMKDIHASGEHVMSLINDLLDLSKIEAGKMELEFISVDVNRVVADCVVLMQPIAARGHVVMRKSLAPSMPNIVADERALRQIILNILSNAVKFNVHGGQVIVATALTDSGHAVIRVRDTGAGMNEHEIGTAMEPFRRLQNTQNVSGTGLGLPITKALVEANRASLTIKSKKDEGTLVEVTFPPTRVLAE